MTRSKKHMNKAAAEAQTAADKGAAAIDHAVAAVNQAVAALAASISTAQDKAAPAAKQALGKSLEAAQRTREAVEPRLVSAYGMMAPGVDSARTKVADDLLPKLNELLREAEKHPAVAEATRRGAATLAAVRGEVDAPKGTLVPAKKKGGVTKGIAKLVAASALLAGAAVAVRQFLLSKDEGWTAHDPSTAYTKDRHTPDSKLVYTTGTDEVTEEVPVAPDVTTEADPINQMAGEGGTVQSNLPTEDHAADAPLGDVPGGPIATYGEGSYVGNEPPADHVIKGNERSKKYHLPESAGYERTIADVWFVSEDAAQAAGFSKAQR